MHIKSSDAVSKNLSLVEDGIEQPVFNEKG